MAPFSWFLILFLFHSHILPFHSSAQHHFQWPLFSCGRLDLMGFPFINNGSSDSGSFILNCTDYYNPEVHFPKQKKWYAIEKIYYLGRSISITDPELQDQLDTNRCDSLSNFTPPVSPSVQFYITFPAMLHPIFKCKREKFSDHSQQQQFLQSLHNYTDCIDDYDLYFTGDFKKSLPPLPDTFSNRCSTVELPVISELLDPSKPVKNLTSLWTSEYSLSWEILPACYACNSIKGGLCQENTDGTFKCGGLKNKVKGNVRRRKIIIALSISTFAFILLLLLLMMMLYHCSRKGYFKRTKNAQLFEDFLQNHPSLSLKRYSYSEIKKMTKSFQDKLGQGGYGGVFKGKLLDGRFVAVKVLTESKGNGEEFINEVASIGRTSHVNIVSLLGFCCERSKRALVYEFMPNGSLDKFIYLKSPNSCSSLSLETLYDIAIGIAKGLEYLHIGCSRRIVHFDIKPHNILLDQNFSPKISDFGLAKLCTRKDSIMSMLGIRGTVGYIAPEMVLNYGGVSHKSDVYSYGMMVLEMVGARHNTDVRVNRTSEIYFPYWIYEHLEEEEALRLHGVVSAEQKEIARKMILVGLWCIQTKPLDRPSINRALEMLEGSLESLETPPKPFLYSPERSLVDSSSV